MSVHGLERNQGYSGIEVVSSNAPERAYSQHAPERYFPYSDPQVSYDHSPPLVDHAQGNELPEKALPSQPGPPDPQPKEKGVLTLKIPKKWLLLACAIVILLGIALGVGLGVGLTRKNEQSTPTDSSSNESPSTRYGLQILTLVPQLIEFRQCSSLRTCSPKKHVPCRRLDL